MSAPLQICSMAIMRKYMVGRAIYTERPVVANFTSPSAVGTTWRLQITPDASPLATAAAIPRLVVKCS